MKQIEISCIKTRSILPFSNKKKNYSTFLVHIHLNSGEEFNILFYDILSQISICLKNQTLNAIKKISLCEWVKKNFIIYFVFPAELFFCGKADFWWSLFFIGKLIVAVSPLKLPLFKTNANILMADTFAQFYREMISFIKRNTEICPFTNRNDWKLLETRYPRCSFFHALGRVPFTKLGIS